MNKLAFGDIWNAIQPSVLPGLMGAGLGAGGMAAFGPQGEDNAEDPNGKKHQMLKNLALGASLGGLTGAGAGQAYNLFNKGQSPDMNLAQRGLLGASAVAQNPLGVTALGGTAMAGRSYLGSKNTVNLKRPGSFDYTGAVTGKADPKALSGAKSENTSWLKDMFSKSVGKPTLNTAKNVVDHFHIPEQTFDKFNPAQKAQASMLRDEMLGTAKDVSPGRLFEKVLLGPRGVDASGATSYSWKNPIRTGGGVVDTLKNIPGKFKGPTYGELTRMAPENLPFHIKHPTITRGARLPLLGLAGWLAGKTLPPIDNVIGGDALQRLKESQGWRPGM